MSLKFLLVATFLVATGCFSPDVAACGPDGLCKEEEPKAQNAAQGLLSMGSFAHRPLGSQQAAIAQTPVKLNDAPDQPVVPAQPPRKSTVVHAQKQADVAPKPLPVHRAARKRKPTLVLARDLEKSKLTQGKGSKTQNQILAPLSSNPHHGPHHDSDDNHDLESEDPDKDLVEGFDKDLDTDESVGTDVVQAIERSTKRGACTPCEFKLYTEKDCTGVLVETINLGCGDSACSTKQEVAEVATVASIEASRKACGIKIKTDKEKVVSFKDKFPGCENIDKQKGIPKAIKTNDAALCRRKGRR